jgi:hypothetical protein
VIGAVAPRGARQTIVAAFTERLPTKFAAIILALVLWAIVRGEEPTEVVMAVRFAPMVDATLELTGGAPDSVQVVVSGRTRELLKLRNQPPVVRRRFDEGTPARVRVTIQPADVEFPLGVQATAREVRPATATLTFRTVRTPPPDDR